MAFPNYPGAMFGSPFPPPYGWTGPMPGPGYGQPMFASGPQFPPVYTSLDPTFSGSTTYKYRTPNGEVPNQGAVPGAPQQAPAAMPCPGVGFGAQATMGMCADPMNTWRNPWLQPADARNIPPPSAHPYNGCHIKYFENNFVGQNPNEGETVTAPPDQFFNPKEIVLPGSTTVAELIEKLECIYRADYHLKPKTFPRFAIGVCRLFRIGSGPEDRKFCIGSSIFLTSQEARSSIDEVFRRSGNEIWLLRLPV